jgi:hypothetical protein
MRIHFFVAVIDLVPLLSGILDISKLNLTLEENSMSNDMLHIMKALLCFDDILGTFINNLWTEIC